MPYRSYLIGGTANSYVRVMAAPAATGIQSSEHSCKRQQTHSEIGTGRSEKVSILLKSLPASLSQSELTPQRKAQMSQATFDGNPLLISSLVDFNFRPTASARISRRTIRWEQAFAPPVFHLVIKVPTVAANFSEMFSPDLGR